MRVDFTLDSFRALQALVTTGFDDWKKCGEVNATYDGDLVIFNYTPKAQYDNRWNWFETVSRGLILNRKTGEIVARPFDKFFNWHEGGRRSTGHIVTVTEKVDGSLGILHRTDEGYRIATRGSFHGEQAEWASKFLGPTIDDLPNAWTLLFEIVYPENRIVVDYGPRKALVLLAVRDRFTGAYLPFFPDVYELGLGYGWPTPKVYAFDDVETIIEDTGRIGPNEEGYVVEFSDGQRFKFKGDRYRELHKLVMGLTFKNTLKAVEEGTVEYIRSQVPEETRREFEGWIEEIAENVSSIKWTVDRAMERAPTDDRKTFALWVKENAPEIAPYLFLAYDQRPINAMILKNAFKDRLSRQDARIEDDDG